MDYSRSGGPKQGRNQPRHTEKSEKVSGKGAKGAPLKKADLLERMKAVAIKNKTQD